MTVRWVKLELDLAQLDLEPHRAAVQRVLETGVELVSLASLGSQEENLRRLYELNATCSADIPDRGTFHTWEAYRRLRIDVPGFDPALVTLARADQAWIGMAATSDHGARGFAFNEMTGVLRPHRQRGIAMALKVVNLEATVRAGVSVVRTIHHPDNEGIIQLNRSLGYTEPASPW
ncbi:MAG: hypothetical protein KTR31_15325 [Myxococcales bacterium]|nr:hypothetical protein [Myxococcales bacterium]